MLEVLQQDYIRTTSAKGLTQSQIILRHALKNSLISLLTTIGIVVGGLLSGSAKVKGLPEEALDGDMVYHEA